MVFDAFLPRRFHPVPDAFTLSDAEAVEREDDIIEPSVDESSSDVFRDRDCSGPDWVDPDPVDCVSEDDGEKYDQV
jgi:hypothetical protein